MELMILPIVLGESYKIRLPWGLQRIRQLGQTLVKIGFSVDFNKAFVIEKRYK